MKAPDKIYARITAGSLDARLTPGTMFGEPYPEYIRKEALLEMLKKEEKWRIESGDDYYLPVFNFIHDLIDKLNSL